MRGATSWRTPSTQYRNPDQVPAGRVLVVGASHGRPRRRPEFDDGSVCDARCVVWATGFRDDYRWVEPAPLGDDGYPVTDRGVTSVPGLYFMGLPFRYAFSSAMVLGVSRDAAYVARHIAAASRAADRVPALA